MKTKEKEKGENTEQPVFENQKAMEDYIATEIAKQIKAKDEEIAAVTALNEELQTKLQTANLATQQGEIVFELFGNHYKSNCEVPFICTIDGQTHTRKELLNSEQGKKLLQAIIDKGGNLFTLIEKGGTQ
jgi:hypothetical protein